MPSASSETRASSPLLSFVILLAGSLLVGVSAGMWLAPLAAWIGPALLIRFARDHKVWRGFGMVAAGLTLAFVLAFGGIWWAFGGLLAVAILAVFYGLVWTLPYLADRVLVVRLQGFAASMVYPLAATTLEFVYIRTSPLGAWGATGFTQYGVQPLMQLASVTGMVGITFLMGWFASLANKAWEHRARLSLMRRELWAFGGVLAVVLAFGALRLTLAPLTSTSQTARVAGITILTEPGFIGKYHGQWETAEAQQAIHSLREAYFDATAREARAGAQVVIWPEAAGIGSEVDDAALIDKAKDVAQEYGIYLTVPLGTQFPDPARLQENRLLVIDPGGEVVIDHLKYGGVAIEGSAAGSGVLQAASTPLGVISAIICYDADFPINVQRAGQLGAGLILVPSYDWLTIDPIHSQMAVFRAIENGMSLVRQVNEGRSIAVDPYGRVLAQTDFFGASDRTMVAQVPTAHVPTLYTAFGRWLDWLAPIGFLGIVGLAVFGRKDQAA
jgi:apolipoprotein N-acyltransferase